MELWLRYDSAGDWVRAAALELQKAGSLTLPIRPRRCDHAQLRITGSGPFRLYALTQLVERGSDGGK